MALIDRAITGAKERLRTAETHLQQSKGSKETIEKKQRQVDVCRITLEALETMKNRDRAIEYIETLMDNWDNNIEITDIELAHTIEILKGRE